jgi:MFS transporter, AAHS family, 4-hydroxybenzoate transporter
MMQSKQDANATASFDNGQFGMYQRFIVIICALIAMLDGFDTQAIGFVAPAIASDWGVPVATFGIVFAIGLVGGLLGAVAFGNIADRIGRRRTLIATVTLFAIGSLATTGMTSLMGLATCRFVTSLGLGGAMPSIIALTSEYLPARIRGTMVAAMFCGFPLGAVVGAIVSAQIVGPYGWQSVFIVGGMLPLLLVPLLVRSIPESIQWLASRNRFEEIDAILLLMKKTTFFDRAPAISAASEAKASLAGLFREGRALGSLMLAAIFFFSLLLVFLLVSWIPALAVQSGYTLQSGVLAAAMLNLTGIAGGLTFGRLSDRFGTFAVVGAAYCTGGIGVALLALTGLASMSIFAFAAIAGVFCIGTQLCAVSIAAEYYPAPLRATGLGWAMGTGRIGGIVGPLIGSMLLSGMHPADQFYWLVAAISGAAGIAVLTMGVRTGALSRKKTRSTVG